MRRWRVELVVSTALCASISGGPGSAAPKTDARPGSAASAYPGRGAMGLTILSLPEPLEMRLRLTAEQKARWTELQNSLKRRPQVAARPGTLVDPAASFVQAQAAQRQAEADALALLVPEQRKAWELMKRAAEQFQGFGHAGLGLLTVDGLSPEQRSHLKELVPQAQARRKELLRPEPRGIKREQVLERVRAFDIELEAVVRRMLTPEQALQFDAALPLLPR